MTDISATIRTLTLSASSVSDLVGTRMYSDALPQKRKNDVWVTSTAFPAISYTTISTRPYEHLGGIVDLTQSRIQIDCYDRTRSGANQLADKVRLAIEKYRGTVAGQFVNEINYINDSDSFERPQHGTDQRIYKRTQDYIVSFRTTTN